MCFLFSFPLWLRVENRVFLSGRASKTWLTPSEFWQICLFIALIIQDNEPLTHTSKDLVAIISPHSPQTPLTWSLNPEYDSHLCLSAKLLGKTWGFVQPWNLGARAVGQGSGRQGLGRKARTLASPAALGGSEPSHLPLLFPTCPGVKARASGDITQISSLHHVRLA